MLQIHINGGIVQGLMEAANQDGLLSEKDKAELERLQSLPKDRLEYNGEVIGSLNVPEIETFLNQKAK